MNKGGALAAATETVGQFNLTTPTLATPSVRRILQRRRLNRAETGQLRQEWTFNAEITVKQTVARVPVSLLIRSLLRDEALQGLVIAGLGLGDVTDLMFDAIKEARTRGIPVVISTRVLTGRIFPLNAAKGGALALRGIGCVLADNLSPQKARILLMLALTKSHDVGALRQYFDN